MALPLIPRVSYVDIKRGSGDAMVLHLVEGELPLKRKLIVAYAAWGRGDIEALLALAADDCEFTIIGNAALNPHSGTRFGTDGIRQALREFHSEFTMRDMIVERLAFDGDVAVAHWHCSLGVRRTGRVYDCERLDLLEIRDGLVTKVKSFYDSATMALATGRAQVAVPEVEPKTVVPARLMAVGYEAL